MQSSKNKLDLQCSFSDDENVGNVRDEAIDERYLPPFSVACL